MLTEQEIRIGNWVKPDFSDTMVKLTLKDGDAYIIYPEIIQNVIKEEPLVESISKLPTSNLEGIQITPAVLEHFGFLEHEFSDETYWYHAKKVVPHGVIGLFYVTEKSSNYETGYVFKTRGEKICESIKYFHQLQNCFFDESGVEQF
jgi:hypothetical protein